MAAAQLSTAD